MRIQGVDLITFIDQLSYGCGINVLSGSVRQSFDKSYGEYNESRAMIPLVLLPWIGSYDAANGAQGYTTQLKLQQVTWVLKNHPSETANANGEKPGITLNSTPVLGYKIAVPVGSEPSVSVSIGSGANATTQTFPAWSLIVEEDVPGVETREIEAHIFCIDPQTGSTVERVSSVELSTNTTESRSLRLLANVTTPINLIIDPARKAKDVSTGKRIDTIGCQLYADNAAVPDANAVYWWYFWDLAVNSYEPRMITADNQFFVISGLNVNGTFDKQLEINADRFNRLILMCRAEYWDGTGTRPSAPSDESADLKVIFNRSRRYNRHIRGEVQTLKGVRITPDTEVKRRLQLFDNKGDFTNEEMDEHFQINWSSKTSTGVTKAAGSGIEVAGIASQFGVTASVSSALIPEVLERKAFKPLLLNSQILTMNGAALMFQNLG